MKTYRYIILAAVLLLSTACKHGLKDGDYRLSILSTNDVHGHWFDSGYVDGKPRRSLLAVQYYIDSVRRADGVSNVLLLDAGDCLQGDNAPYYFNYVDTLTPHLFPRLLKYMRYDAVAMGNHDIETGHPVYDRVAADLSRAGIPFLAGNAIRNDNARPFFPLYRMVKKAGLRIAVIGYNNANIAAWLGEELWSGMHFVPIGGIIQQDVDFVRAKEKPDVVVVAMHTACGQGDGTILEAEALDVFNQVRGVDWILCGHDHRPYVETRDSCALLNSGSHCRYIGHGKMQLRVSDGKIVHKSFETGLIPVKAEKADPVMREHFRKDFEAVKAFTLQEVGVLNTELYTRDAYSGMCDYMNLIHTLCLSRAAAQISLAAPLTYNGHIRSGVLVFNDLFTLYPFENQLYVAKMSGAEVCRYLEASYDKWINTISRPGDPVLKIHKREDARTQQTDWSFENRAYNFDSAAGICYTVDVTRPFGQRIKIASMADGTPFDPAREYHVAMTSYRASGGGGLLKEAGVDQIEHRVVARYPEIRTLLYERLQEDPSIDKAEISDPRILGGWKFVPETLASKRIEDDMKLLFGKN